MANSLTTLKNNVIDVMRSDPALMALQHATNAEVATRALLKAVTGQTDTNIRLVQEITSNVITFLSLYIFDDDSVSADDGYAVLEPDAGSGRWLRIARGDLGSYEWSNVPGTTDGGHVFEGLTDLLSFGRNRGRVPFFEVEFGEGSFVDSSVSGGYTEINITVRGWNANDPFNKGENLVRDMLFKAARAIKNWGFDENNVGYWPGDTGGTSSPRIYSEVEIEFPVVQHVVGASFGDMTATIRYSYNESTLV